MNVFGYLYAAACLREERQWGEWTFAGAGGFLQFAAALFPNFESLYFLGSGYSDVIHGLDSGTGTAIAAVVSVVFGWCVTQPFGNGKRSLASLRAQGKRNQRVAEWAFVIYVVSSFVGTFVAGACIPTDAEWNATHSRTPTSSR